MAKEEKHTLILMAPGLQRVHQTIKASGSWEWEYKRKHNGDPSWEEWVKESRQLHWPM